MNKHFKKYFNKKGLTVIEVMIAVVIAGAIASAVGAFLVTHIKSYEITQDIIDVQYEGQLALNNMSRIAMESRGVHSINDYSGAAVTLTSANGTVNTSQISFIGIDQATGGDEYHIFTFDYASGSTDIYYSNSTSSALSNPYNEGIFARNISGFQVAPGKGSLSGSTGGETFDESDAIEFILTLQEGDASLDISTLAKYRNKRN